MNSLMCNVVDSALSRVLGVGVWRSRVPVSGTVGTSAAAVVTFAENPEMVVKFGCGAAQAALVHREAQTTEWAHARGLRVPEILDAGYEGEHAWFVARRIAGRDAAMVWSNGERKRIINVLADVVHAFQAVDVSSCPFARLEIEENAVLSVAEKIVGSSDDSVVCHGDFTLPNVLIDPETLECAGVVDLGSLGVGDLDADLADMVTSLRDERNPQYGEDAVQQFLDRYTQITR